MKNELKLSDELIILIPQELTTSGNLLQYTDKKYIVIHRFTTYSASIDFKCGHMHVWQHLMKVYVQHFLLFLTDYITVMIVTTVGQITLCHFTYK